MPIPAGSAAQWALAAIQDGLSASAGLSRYRSQGGRIANETWYKLTGELQATLAAREGVYNEPVNRIPTASEIQRWTTQKAKGYIQQVEVLARDRDTGEIISIPYSLTGRTLRSRASAIKAALSVYAGEQAKRYNQQVLGAVYSGTYEAVPEGG